MANRPRPLSNLAPMPEGDTIHRISRRIEAALAGRRLDRALAPNPRSPLHVRATELDGATLTRSEAFGKHLLVHFDNDRVVHSHLGMNGRWRISVDGSEAFGKPWLLLGSGAATAHVSGGKILRLVSAAKARNDPAIAALGPDPLRPDFDEEAAAARILGWEPSERIGAALLDQSLIAGVGNVIRIEALWLSQVSPWRAIADLEQPEAAALVKHNKWVMETAIATGRRPKQIYGSLARRPCPRCGGSIRTHRQGDDSRITYWCEGCQK
jgi:endonuclease-8